MSLMMMCVCSMLMLNQPTTQPVDEPTTRPTTQPIEAPTTQPIAHAESDPAGLELARAIHKANGGDVWPSVKRIRFTFNVETDGKVNMSAQHDWNVRTGDVSVKVGQDTFRTNVYADGPRAANAKQAFSRWTNDSYWLLMPLKLLDPAVIHSAVTPVSKDIPPSTVMLTIRFQNVGLTPTDQYDLRIDTKENRVVHWTYRPNPERSMGFTWEKYSDYNGLLLATNHVSDDGRRRIFFTNVRVDRE